MIAAITDKNTLLSLRPLDLAGYLRATGWQPIHSRAEDVSVWMATDERGAAYEIMLPLDRGFRDFAQRMYEVMAVLGRFERRSQLEIITDLSTHASDVIRIRAHRTASDDGTVALEDGARLVQHARDMMLAAACAAHQRRSYYPTRKAPEAVDYVKSVRMGQTERGSYVLTILSRVPPAFELPETQQLDLIEEPFPRKVILTLAKGLHAVNLAAAQSASSGNLDAFQNAVQEGVSANLCDALYGMSRELSETSDLEINLGISAARPLPTGSAVPRGVILAVDAMDVIAEGSRLLRAVSPYEAFELQGYVIKLDSPDATVGGKITVYCLVESAYRKVQITLQGVEYCCAIEAHKSGQLVQCYGILKREGRGWILDDPKGFALAAEE